MILALAITLLSACGGDEPVTSANDCPAADPADATMITDARAALLVGLAEVDAEQCAMALGWTWRVGERDGEVFAVTADYSTTRVTVIVTNGAVTSIAVG